MYTAAQNFPWVDELEKTIITSLATSFGMDFLLHTDKDGGNVDTIHNVRNGIWATETESERYSQRPLYDANPYHKHHNYIDTGRQDKAHQQTGSLHDSYRNTAMSRHEKRNLDHVISAKEIHDDPGRVLAGLDGVALANQSSNLQATHESINKSKKQAPIEAYLSKLPYLIDTHTSSLEKSRERLGRLPRTTAAQQQKVRELEAEIRKTESKLKELKAIDPAKMRQRDVQARAAYNQEINRSYYTDSKFLKQVSKDIGLAGLKMGTRQMLGLILAEVWFELRNKLPLIIEKNRNEFILKNFFSDLNLTLKNIWKRIQNRFSGFIENFKNGVFSGIVGSLTSTLFNIFATTQKAALKIIREIWGHLVKAIKLLVFNPENLGFTDLCKGAISIVSVGAATIVGSLVYTHLIPICNFPFGSELAAFASAFVTGITTLGLSYVMLHSPMANKLWEFIQNLMPHAGKVREFQKINAELDRYLIELGQLEFNLDPTELEDFSQQLDSCNDEIQRTIILQKELKNRNINLPFEIGNATSTRQWLSSLAQ